MFINLKSSDVGATLLHAKNPEKIPQINNSTHLVHELYFPVLLTDFRYLCVLVIHRAATGKRKCAFQFQNLFRVIPLEKCFLIMQKINLFLLFH
jgi:hypothetical protein